MAEGTKLEGGAYEVIRGRLNQQGGELLARLQRLDEARKAVFGAVEPRLLATQRIQTAHNCIPRGMIALPQDRFIFGYNVQMGLKSQVAVEDVFAIFRYDPADHSFHEETLEIINQRPFIDDFTYLYKYYRKTVFAKFLVIGPHLFMAFRISDDEKDIKVFKWLIREDGLDYLGNRFEHEYLFPEQHSFKWTRAHRDMQRMGKFPHLSIEDRLFVETTGGDLTIKVEDNTDTGEGIYSEPVDYRDQTLDDAEVFYATLGSLIFLRIKPYQEKVTRYFIFNEKVKEVRRVDSIAHSCVGLPENHGVIFADGYYLDNGEFKQFAARQEAMLFERVVRAPNGEDFLYVFYQRSLGIYQLMPYHLINQKVENPIEANGYALFENGALAYFKAHDDARRSHNIQVWQTPFSGREIAVAGQADNFLFKVGNADIVRAMAGCFEVYHLLQRPEPYEGLYLDLTRLATRLIDGFFWLDRPEAAHLREVLQQILATGQAAIDEFEKVQRIREATAEQTRALQAAARRLFSELDGSAPPDVRGFIERLARLRRLRGEVIGLRELRYADLPLCEELEAKIGQRSEAVGAQTVTFLLSEEALDPYHQALRAQQSAAEAFQTAVQGKELLAALDENGGQLELLIETLSNLKIDDATQTTRIIDRVSLLFTELNQVKGRTRNRRRELMRVEGAAQFHAQLKLLEQSAANSLEMAETPERADEFLTKAIVQVEELETRYAEFDEFVEVLTQKRSELQDAFATRRAALQEARNRRATQLAQSADRVLKGVEQKARSLKEVAEINGYFAADLMVDKVRDLAAQLKAMGESMRSDEVLTRLKTLQGDAIRQLKDRQELFAEGDNIIRFGKHSFTVNTQPLELTTVQREGELFFHLTGTQYFEAITDQQLLGLRHVWTMQTPAESPEVYRGEFLAYQGLLALMKGELGTQKLNVADFLALGSKERLVAVQQLMAPRYVEGYTKGLHDADATAILSALAAIHSKVGLLRYAPNARALALVFWQEAQRDGGLADYLRERLDAFGSMLRAYPEHHTQRAYIEELSAAVTAFCQRAPFFPTNLAPEAAAYLFYELVVDEHFTASQEAAQLADAFLHEVISRRLRERLDAARAAVAPSAVAEFQVLRDWLDGYAAHHRVEPESREYLAEAAAHLLRGGVEKRRVVEVALTAEVEGLRGEHPVIGSGGRYHLNYRHFTERLRAFTEGPSADFLTYEARKRELVTVATRALRLHEFRPQVFSGFVRNRLLDTVYLPLIGDNLAKQIGTAGASGRTDRMGLLLLISPPGYGKTTVMEYVANRLGITFVKVNGPSLGHEVTSLDPGQCANLAARQEVEKINLAFEMGDNVMIYLDDIQHTNPELLQKFISLCDGTRRIEGVYRGRSRTYDFRGRKVAVVMAGNPYTETGDKFQVPDMLANRADTYNLGDIIGEDSDAFEASFIENALTSNPSLATLAGRGRADLTAVMAIARTGQREGVEFESSFSMDEVAEMVSVMKKLFRVRDTVLKVNLAYVRSAAQADAYRTEPPFKLQGSYRNMNRLAAKVLPIMTDREVEQLIDDHYQGEAQTLADAAESNLLKFREIDGKLSPEQAERWEQIKQGFRRQKSLGGTGETDPVNRVVGQLVDFNQHLEVIGNTLSASSHAQSTGLRSLADQEATTAAASMAVFQEIAMGLSARLEALVQGQQSSILTLNQGHNAALREALEAVGPTLQSMVQALQNSGEAQRDGQRASAERAGKFLSSIAETLREGQLQVAAQTSTALQHLAAPLGTIADQVAKLAEHGGLQSGRSEALEEILATLARAETEQTKAVQAWAAERAAKEATGDPLPAESRPPIPTTATSVAGSFAPGMPSSAHFTGEVPLRLDPRTEALLQSILIAFHHLFKHTGIDRPQTFHVDPPK